MRLEHDVPGVLCLKLRDETLHGSREPLPQIIGWKILTPQASGDDGRQVGPVEMMTDHVLAPVLVILDSPAESVFCNCLDNDA